MGELELGAKDDPDGLGRFQLIGRSPPFLAALALIRKIARCDATTLLHGGTGTGKELAARAVHYLGARRANPFLPVNCGALPDNLIANELFGHVRGAYTDAREEQRGLVADARGGTLFLDEVESLSPQAQVALLRFLPEGIYRPLGGRSDLRADVRIIAATNVDLHALVRAGRFRADLLYRLDVMNVSMPPLKARGDDVILLAEFFLKRLSVQSGGPAPALAPEAIPALMAHEWPGNVRELENLMHRAFILAEGDVARPHVFLKGSGTGSDSADGGAAADHRRIPVDQGLARAKAAMVEAFERSFVSRVMSESRGNVTAAARRCGKERRTFGKLLKKLGIDPRAFCGDEPAPE